MQAHARKAKTLKARQGAFSLTELLVCLAILCLILLGAVCTDSDFYTRNRLDSATHHLKVNVSFARNMAILEERSIIMTALAGDWSKGFRLCYGKSPESCLRGDALLREHVWPRSTMQMSWHGFRSNDTLYFAPDLLQMACNGHFLLAQNGKQKRLSVNRLGVVREAEPCKLIASTVMA
ncbi:MAG: prepilin-type N-terminal cleavage/methylation domain-containing protein [Legionellaceae bacterium]|nr:prepilin-type N-terminal cleavage/methylation domain-containing protein [Legionellaceae bacterium]